MKILFCLPGREFSGQFLQCWTNLLGYCYNQGHSVIYSQKYSCNIYYARNMCLGGNILAGKNQKPYSGRLDYDYMMWIDSDIAFSPQQFQTLLDHKQDIVSGLYLMDGGTAYATVKDWDEEHFQQNGSFHFMTPDDLEPHKKQNKLFPVVYTGFGFILIKKGVFESMEYPWFRPEFVNIRGSTDFTMEDVAWCREVNRLGYKVMIDPNIVVGHEKIKTYI